MPSVTEKQDKKYGDHDNLGKSPEERQTEVENLENDFSSPAFGEEPDVKAAETLSGAGTPKTKADDSEQSQLDGAIKYRNEDEGKKRSKGKGFLESKKGKWLTGGGVGGILIGIIVGMFMTIPLKVISVANNLQSTFFSSSEQATEDMTDRLLRGYIVQKVMPGMMEGKCTTTKATRSCAAVSPGSGLIPTLYNAWRDAKLENTLATKHGIVIERYGGNKFRLITPATLQAKGTDLGDFDASNASAMDSRLGTAMGRTDVRREVRAALEKETFGKRLMYRYKVGRLLERKYGIVRCLVACESRDKVKGSVDSKKAAFKSYFIERVVTPRSEMLGTAMLCAVNGFDCTERSNDANEYGERPSQFESEIQARLQERRAGYAESGDLDELGKRTEEIRTKGFTYAIISKLTNETAAKITTKGIPIVGWVDLAARLFSGAQNIGPSVKKMNYVINSSAMVTTYMMYRTNADEIKTGDVDMDLVGSVASSLSPADGSQRTDQGGAGAEGSPYYSTLMGQDKARSSALAPLSNTVYAAGNAYTCDDGNPVPQGEQVCNEEKLVNARFVQQGADGISAIANSPLAGAGFGADLWLKTGGKLLDEAGGFLGDVVGGAFGLLTPKDIEDKIKDMQAKLGSLMADFVNNYMINNPVSDNPSGGRNFNMAAGGADVAGNDFCHYGLGCEKVSDAQAAQLRQERQNEELETFKSKSMFARMFDTSSSYSLISKIAMAIPGSSLTSMSQSMASTLSNPTSVFGGFSHSSIVSAANTADPMGITQYAYPKNAAVFKDDPEATWAKENCDDPETIKNWGKKSETNPDTGMEEHSVTNPCKLLEASVGMAGGIFTDDVLTQEDLGNINAGGPGSVNVATYNLRLSSLTGNVDTRSQLAAKTILEEGIDIVSTQEAADDQVKAVQKNLPGYSHKSVATRTIFWVNSRFSLEGSGEFGVPKASLDHPNKMLWVRLKSLQGGGEVYVIDAHADVDSSENRKTTAEKIINDVVPKFDAGIPIIITGDMNSVTDEYVKVHKPSGGNNDTKVYDVIMGSGKFDYAYNLVAASSRENADCNTTHDFGKQECGKKLPGRHIDQIYVLKNSNITVNSWKAVTSDATADSSDHIPVYVNINMPGF